MGIRTSRVGVMLSAVVVLAGCTEKLDSSVGGPIACLDSETQIITDTLPEAVTLDQTVSAIAGLGTEQLMLLASRGDSLDTRLILRYDTLPQSYTRNAVLDTITAVDSAFLRFTFDSTAKTVTSP